MIQLYFERDPDSLMHDYYPCERWYLMNQHNLSLNKPDSLTAILPRSANDESVNQPSRAKQNKGKRIDESVANSMT